MSPPQFQNPLLGCRVPIVYCSSIFEDMYISRQFIFALKNSVSEGFNSNFEHSYGLWFVTSIMVYCLPCFIFQCWIEILVWWPRASTRKSIVNIENWVQYLVCQRNCSTCTLIHKMTDMQGVWWVPEIFKRLLLLMFW